MSKPRHPAHAMPPSEMEATRALLRELHEAMKDARAVLRDMRAVTDEGRQIAATAVDAMNSHVRALQDHMDEQTHELARAIALGASQIEQMHATMLGYDTPEKMLGYIVAQLLDQLIEPIVDTVSRRLPGIVEHHLDHVMGGGKGKRRVVMANGLEILRAIGVEPPPPGSMHPGTEAAAEAQAAGTQMHASRAVTVTR